MGLANRGALHYLSITLKIAKPMPLPALRLPDPAPTPLVDTELLAFLRVQWARCRCLPRRDLFACSTTPLSTPEARTVALLRALECPDALGGLRLYQPGATEQSFDEKWVLAALAAGAARDTDSLTFLLHSRLGLPARRQIAALILGLARALEK